MYGRCNMKFLYIFQCPFGKRNSKIGKTSYPGDRLGNYQNSYSAEGHLAQFDYVFYGCARAVDNLEDALKKEFDWDIQQDGRGFSEWVSNHTSLEILKKVEDVIDGYRSKVKLVPKEFLPLTINNLDELKDWLTNNP